MRNVIHDSRRTKRKRVHYDTRILKFNSTLVCIITEVERVVQLIKVLVALLFVVLFSISKYSLIAFWN